MRRCGRPARCRRNAGKRRRAPDRGRHSRPGAATTVNPSRRNSAAAASATTGVQFRSSSAPMPVPRLQALTPARTRLRAALMTGLQTTSTCAAEADARQQRQQRGIDCGSLSCSGPKFGFACRVLWPRTISFRSSPSATRNLRQRRAVYFRRSQPDRAADVTLSAIWRVELRHARRRVHDGPQRPVAAHRARRSDAGVRRRARRATRIYLIPTCGRRSARDRRCV